jgi:hypothetical protein
MRDDIYELSYATNLCISENHFGTGALRCSKIQIHRHDLPCAVSARVVPPSFRGASKTAVGCNVSFQPPATQDFVMQQCARRRQIRSRSPRRVFSQVDPLSTSAPWKGRPLLSDERCLLLFFRYILNSHFNYPLAPLVSPTSLQASHQIREVFETN